MSKWSFYKINPHAVPAFVGAKEESTLVQLSNLRTSMIAPAPQ